MRRNIIFLFSLIVYAACGTKCFTWEEMSIFILQNKTNDIVKLQLYTHEANDTVIQLSPNDTCHFSYFMPGSPYRMPLSEYDSLDIIIGNNLNRYKSIDYDGPFCSGYYTPVDTIVVKGEKKKSKSLYKYILEYYITDVE